MRFYNIDGNELDTQDPKFFIEEDYFSECLESMGEMLNDYI